MKIAIDIRPIGQQRTGDEVYTLNLVQNLAKIDSENFYFLLTNTKEEARLKKIKKRIFENNGVVPENFKIISIVPASKFLWTFFLLPFWIAKNNIDILHVQYITPLFLTRKTKLITTIHDVSFDAHPKFIKKSDLFFLKTLIPLSFKRVNKVIAVSDFTRNEILKYHKISSEKIHTIYNGGAAEGFFKEYSEEQTSEISKKYALTNPFIFHIGTLQPRKNIPFLLKAYQLFQKEYAEKKPEISNVHLCLTGNLEQHNFDEKIRETLNQIEKETPEIFEKIKFLGFVEELDLPIILQMSKVAVSVSLYEGFGLPAIEAMAAGVPLVSNDRSCLKEIVGEAANFYNQNDQNDLAKRIFEVIMDEDLKKGIIQQEKQRALYFSWKKCAQETLDLYNLVENKK